MLLILLYSYTRLATASPYIISILYILAIANYSIIRKDLNKGNINKLIEVN